MTRRAAFLAALGPALFAAGCGGGGGGHSGPRPTSQILFDPASQPPFPAMALALVQTGTAQSVSGGSVIVGVTITDTINIFGADFDLVFDPAYITFVKATQGAFISATGTVPTQLVFATQDDGPSPNTKRVVVGIFRTGPAATNTNAVGQQTLVVLEFKANGPAGSPPSELKFDSGLKAPEVVSMNGTVVSSGTVQGGTLHIDPL